MAGLIDDTSANNLYKKGIINKEWADNIDVNEIRTPTVFSTRGSATNTPNDSNWWIFEVNQGIRDNSTIVQQKAIQFDNPSNYYVRTYAGNTWTDWASCGNFGYNSLAELAGGVAIEIRNSYIPYDSLNKFVKVVLNSVADKETGIHMVATGGPVYHVVMLRYDSNLYSAILSTYDFTDAMPLYVRYTNGDYKIQYL